MPLDTSEVGIANMALDLCASEEITSFEDGVPDDGVQRARVLGRNFPIVRDTLLEAWTWNFALVRVAPAVLATPPLTQFTVAYQRADDDLKVVDTSLDESWEQPCPGYVWGIGRTGVWQVEGRTIVAYETGLKVRYVSRVTDPTVWPAHFVSAVAAELAARVIYVLTESETARTEQRKHADLALARAKNDDARETPLRFAKNTALTTGLRGGDWRGRP